MAKVADSTNQVKTISPHAEGGPGRHLKGRLRAGDVLAGGKVQEYLSPSLIKLYKYAGFDFVYFEYEHTYFNPKDLVLATLCARDNGLPVIAKTPQLERAEVAKLLDCGIVGIQLPRTETREEVETLRSYMKFPPGGTRAVAPGGWGNTSYAPVPEYKPWMDEQDQETTLVVHIETRVGYENAEEIISTPGVDMVYIGPGDFSVEMGQPGDFDHPDVRGPIEEMIKLCKKYGIPFGTTASGMPAAEWWVAQGAQFFEIIDEMSLIYQGACDVVRDYRELLTQTKA